MTARRKPDIDTLFSVLADPMCRRAIEVLGAGPMRAGELAAALDLAPPAMSRRLKELKATGLVSESHPEFDARVRVYALRIERLGELKSWLARAEAAWAGQLAAFAAHVGKRTGK